jgi:hypothetical protein
MASVLYNNQPLIIEPFLTGSCIIRNFVLQCGIDPASAYQSLLNGANWIDRSESIARVSWSSFGSRQGLLRHQHHPLA